MKKQQQTLVGLVLLVVGAVLLYFGWQSTQSVTGQLSESLTGRYDNETLWLLVGGSALVIAGLFLTIRK